MRAARWRSLLLIALIAASLPTIAAVQYTWLGQLGDLEQLQARTNLTAASRRFSTEFDTHLAHLYGAFHEPRLRTEPLTTIAPHVRTLMRQASPAGLIERVYVFEREPGGPLQTLEVDLTTDRAPAISRSWPAWLDRTGRALDDELVTLPSGLRRNLLDDVPAIVVPHVGGAVDRWLVIELDRHTIASSWLPSLLVGCFGDDAPMEYDVLLSREDVAGEVIYASRPGLVEAGFDDWVSRMPLFALHGRDLDRDSAESLLADAAGHRWRLFVRPQPGAVDAALGSVRTRNLVMSLGTLTLLATSAFLLVISVNRTQSAAREQLEVVARISHELRTPLSTIRCAGENLADNLVASEEDTRQYGRMIQDEATRLTRTVQDILLSCRLQARPNDALSFRPLPLRPILDTAVSDSRLVVGPGAAPVDIRLERDLPEVLADRDALSMVFKNLIQNALTHGGGQPVTVTASSRRSAAGREVLVEVQDRGPGIPEDELPRLYEPFFRGRAALNRRIDGTGIGLNLVRQAVESHGGRIRVSSAVNRGTTFLVTLPGARAATAPRPS